MPQKYPTDTVIVAAEALASDDPTEVIYSNIEVVNALLAEHFEHEEISTQALQSYYVDYFLAQLNNGGFSQFVYNSGWGACIDYITDGFAAMGAVKHLELFDRAAGQMSENPGIEGLKRFFNSEYFGDDNPERDILNEFNEEFYALEETEDLSELNAAWLRGLPNLAALAQDEIDAEIAARVAAQPDRAARVAAALEAEPRYMKLIRALCAAAGQELDRITAGDPSHTYNGEQILAWHFLTNDGHHHMLDHQGRALMFQGDTTDIVAEIEAGQEYGE